MTEQECLVRLLAFSDAIFLPMRLADWVAPMPTILYERRERFATGGLPWHSGEASETGRKKDQRTLERLVADGLLTVHGGERRTSAKLSEAGDVYARALAGMPNVADAHGLLADVIRLEKSGDGFSPMVREIWLAGLADYAPGDDSCGRKILAVQDCALPGLNRGWLKTESDCEGRAWYLATPFGRKVAKEPAPTLPDDLPEADPEAEELYDREVVAFRGKLRQILPANPREIGFLPLPESINISPKRERKPRKATK
jgi:hypothetical protein